MVSTGTRLRKLALLKLGPKHTLYKQQFYAGTIRETIGFVLFKFHKPKKRNVKYSLCFPNNLATDIQFSTIANAH
jgi:hypothetical protein